MLSRRYYMKAKGTCFTTSICYEEVVRYLTKEKANSVTNGIVTSKGIGRSNRNTQS